MLVVFGEKKIAKFFKSDRYCCPVLFCMILFDWGKEKTDQYGKGLFLSKTYVQFKEFFMEKNEMKAKILKADRLPMSDFLSKSLVDESVANMANTESLGVGFGDEKSGDFGVFDKCIKKPKVHKKINNLQKNSVFSEKNVPKRNKLQILKNKSLTDWVKIIFAVSPFVEHMAEFVDGLVDKMSEGSYAHSDKYGSCFNMFDKVIDIIHRKQELINIAVVSRKFYDLLESDVEIDVVKTTLDKTKKIVDIAENGRYKWVYNMRDKIVSRVVCFCRVSDWDEAFFFRHFSNEPLVQYYV